MLQRRPWFAIALALGVLPLTGCAGIPRPSFVQNLLPESREKSLQKLDAQLSLARLSERNGDKQTAEQIYQVALKKYPPNQLVHHRLGVLAAEKAHFEEAASHFDQAAQLGPPSSELVNDIGYNLYLMGRRPEAESAFRQALELNPENKSARINLAMMLGEATRFEESLTEFRRAGTEAEAHVNLAYVKAQAGDLDGAAACYHRALALDGGLKPAAEALIQLTRYQAELKAKSPGKPQGPAIRSRLADSGPNPAATEGISAEKAAADEQAKAARLIDSVSLGEPQSGRQQLPRRNDAAHSDAGNRQVACMADGGPIGGSAENRTLQTPASSHTSASQSTPSPAQVFRHNLDSAPAEAGSSLRSRNQSLPSAPPQTLDAARGNERQVGPSFQREQAGAGWGRMLPLEETGTPSAQRGQATMPGTVRSGGPAAINPGSPGQQAPASREARSGEATFEAANPLPPNPMPMAMDSPWQRPTWSPEMNATLLGNSRDPSSAAQGQTAAVGPDLLRMGPRLDASALPASPDGENFLRR